MVDHRARLFSWISNELGVCKDFLPGEVPIYGHVCLFFPSALTLSARIVRMPSFQEQPWAGSHTASIGLVSHWLLGWKYTIINLVFNIRAYDLYRDGFKCLWFSAVVCDILDLHYLCMCVIINQLNSHVSGCILFYVSPVDKALKTTP